MKEWYKFGSEVKLLGSPKIISEMLLQPEDWKDGRKMFSFCDKLVRLMAEELQGFDVYKEVIQLSEQKTTLLGT